MDVMNENPLPRKALRGGISKSIFQRPCQFLAINAHKMAPRTNQWLQERTWNAPTKGLAWSQPTLSLSTPVWRMIDGLTLQSKLWTGASAAALFGLRGARPRLDTMDSFISLRKSTSPQERQLGVLISNSKQ